MSYQLMLEATPASEMVGVSNQSALVHKSSQRSQMSSEQSLCIVKIFINASIGCICFARGLIPQLSSAYQDRYVADLLQNNSPVTFLSYDGFLAADLKMREEEQSQRFKILVRGKHKEADQILDLVENGVFEALERGYLQAVQFSLAIDEQNPADVVESYTLSFSYTDGLDGERRVNTVKISPAVTQQFFVDKAQKGFRKTIRKLLIFAQELPPLPRRRRLGVNLLYNSRCPVPYEPHGFVASTDVDILFPLDSAQGLSKDSQSLGHFDTSLYQVSLTAGHIKATPKAKPDDTKIPPDTEYPPTSSGLEDLAVSKQLRQMQRSSSLRSSRLVPTQTDPYPPSDSPMVQSQPSRRGPGISVDGKSRRPRNVSPIKMAELIVHVWGMEKDNAEYGWVFDRDELKKNKIKRMNPGTVIRCECTSHHENGPSTMCEVCGFWQHDICYGYRNFRATRKPADHFCYNCLLLPRAKEANRQMQGLVRTRLALIHLYDCGGLRSNELESFVNSINLDYENAEDMRIVQALISQLEQEGFLTAQSDAGDYAVVCDHDTMNKGREEYVGPFAGISDLYHILKDKETAQNRAEAIQNALSHYAGARSFKDGANEQLGLDEWTCEDSFGNQVVRWGLYPEHRGDKEERESRKRSRSVSSYATSTDGDSGTESVEKKPRLVRKMSISKNMINFDLSSETSSEVPGQGGSQVTSEPE